MHQHHQQCHPGKELDSYSIHDKHIHLPHLNVVPLPGLLPEEEGGDAGHEAAQQAVQQATLPQVIGCTVGLAAVAAHRATT